MNNIFVKKDEPDQLKDVAPDMKSLLLYLEQKNGKIVHELYAHVHEKFLKDVHEMSNGLGYMINDDNQWQVIFD